MKIVCVSNQTWESPNSATKTQQIWWNDLAIPGCTTLTPTGQCRPAQRPTGFRWWMWSHPWCDTKLCSRESVPTASAYSPRVSGWRVACISELYNTNMENAVNNGIQTKWSEGLWPISGTIWFNSQSIVGWLVDCTATNTTRNSLAHQQKKMPPWPTLPIEDTFALRLHRSHRSPVAIRPQMTQIFVLLNHRLPIWGFGQSCMIIHGTTLQPVNVFWNALYLQFSSNSNSVAEIWNINFWPFLSVWATREMYGSG